MAEIRLSKLTKQFSIGLARLVEFLNEKGANVEMNPNAKVSDEYLPAIEAKFGEDLKLKKDSEKVTIKLKEIIEMGSKKKPSQEEEEDVLLSEFDDVIDAWIIERLQSIGCDTAKSVLALTAADIAKRADLEDETVEEIMDILRAEFEDEE